MRICNNNCNLNAKIFKIKYIFLFNPKHGTCEELYQKKQKTKQNKTKSLQTGK